MKFTGLFLLLFSLTLTVSAQVPSAINFQGNLTDPITGNVIADNTYDMVFALFDADIDGTELWSESQIGVLVMGGIFNVVLGSVNQMDPVIFSQPVWLQISINGEVLSPRIELASTAYSQAAKAVIGDNFIPNSGNVHLGGNLNVGGFAPTIDVAIDDDDTGLEVPADGTLSFYTNGVERMFLNSVGSLYMGTPYASGLGIKLEINFDDTGSDWGGMWISGSATNTKPYYGYSNGTGQSYTYIDGDDGNKWKLFNGGDRLTVTTTGNVGIGTTAPSDRLSVNGNIATNGNVNGDNFIYNTPKTEYYSISPGSFVLLNYDGTYYMSGSVYGSYLYENSGAASGITYLFAPVHLPQGATVTEFVVYVYDNVASWTTTGELVRNVLSTGGLGNVMANVSTSTDLSTTQTLVDNTITNAVIDNSTNSYVVGIRLRKGASTANQLYGVRITYTVNSAN